MSPVDMTSMLERMEHPEATVLRICFRTIMEFNQVAAFRDALQQQTEVGSGPYVLDFSEVEYLSSAALGLLHSTKRKLMAPGQPLRRTGSWALFAIFSDSASALEAIRQGEADPIVLCSVKRDIQDIFQLSSGKPGL